MADTTERKIADRYVLQTALGRGGMGIVWRAHDLILDRIVAIKEIETPAQLSSSEARAIESRAMREARSAARLTHPAVVTIYDVVREDSQPFIVMEFVDAPTLEQLVRADGPMAPTEAAEMGLDILDALEMAHANGIVHRDVKPSNVMIADGRAKLADFGIAAVKGDPKITATGMILGSPQFMAPEQAQGTASGPTTDLWALGATLYFAVEGRYPFDRGEAIPTLAAVVHDEPSPLRRADRLGPVISALLNKTPDRRPNGMRLRSMLESARSDAGPPVDNRSTAEPAPPPGRVTPPSSTRSASSSPGGLRRWLVPVGAAMILIVGGVVWFQNSGETPPATRSDDPGRESSPNEGSEGGGGQPEDGSEGGGGQPEDPDTSPVAAVPSDWTSYTDPGSGYQLSYPTEWQLIQDAPNSIDFRDPNTGTYLRVQWTTEPGSSPKGAWKTQAKSFAASHEGYEEIGITRTTYKGHKAAVWEFKYNEGGAQLHAADLGFVIEKDYGFALYFQTREENWAGSQQLFEQLKAAFQPPAA